jgi:K+:H+ antiporter
MDQHLVTLLILDLISVLGAGLVAGLICKRIGVSMLVGYLIAGAIIGQGFLGFVSEKNHELHYLSETGVLLLLFSIGLELSLEELVRMGRKLILGGGIQMTLVGAPVFSIGLMFGLPWQSALLVSFACAFSSTVLVFKALSEWGQSTTAHGKRAIGILLFQDLMLVPLLLLLPMLTGIGEQPTGTAFILLSIKSFCFVAAIFFLRRLINDWMVPLFGRMRSVELVVLFTFTILGGAGIGAYLIGLPPMIGALGAGLALGGNRLTQQVDALILPFRETFSAIFFVSLGTLMRFDLLIGSSNGLAIAATILIGVLLLKSVAATVALRMTGLNRRTSLGMGVGLSQMGEFSFVLLSNGFALKMLSADSYNTMLVVGLGSLILTPQLLKKGLGFAETGAIAEETPARSYESNNRSVRQAVVIGIGPIGAQAASRLELTGTEVHLIDFSPLNLQSFAQQGFHTVAGDAVDDEILTLGHVDQCCLAIVTVASDMAAIDIVSGIRRMNTSCRIVVRCRYMANVRNVKKAGADEVISEEAEASLAMVRLIESFSFDQSEEDESAS